MSSIFVNSTVLRWFSHIFEDGKIFVDSCLISAEHEFYRDFEAFLRWLLTSTSSGTDGVTERLREMYRQHFRPPQPLPEPDDMFLERRSLLGQYELPTLADIHARFGGGQHENSTQLAEWVHNLFRMHLVLLRSTPPPSSHSNSSTMCQASTLIPADYPFVIPGGRFTEFYYWDTYWILKGIPWAELRMGMLRNFKGFVERYGLIPNGNRQYYLTRSQPPLFTHMVADEFDRCRFETASSNADSSRCAQILKEMLPSLVKEYEWWMRERSIYVQPWNLNLYLGTSEPHNATPRPESFKEDFDLWNSTQTRSAEDLYANLRAGAESGWDYSSRWFPRALSDQRGLAQIQIRKIVPVDLNAIMCANERYLAMMHAVVDCVEQTPGQEQRCYATFWSEPAVDRSDYPDVHAFVLRYRHRRQAMSRLLYSSKDGTWFDYDLDTQAHRSSRIYPSTLFPLWTRCWDPSIISQQSLEKGVNRVLVDLQVSSLPGGVPTSATFSGEQWDFPNVWAPIQHIVVDSILRLPVPRGQAVNPIAKRLIPRIVQPWMTSNYCGWLLKYTELTKRSYLHFQESDDPWMRMIDQLKRQGYARRKRSITVNDDDSDDNFYRDPHQGGMYEKYDARYVGRPGSGGEYVVQDGFGWTNGVVLDFTRRFRKPSRNASVEDSLPFWFKSNEGELERLGWAGFTLPTVLECGRLMSNKTDSVVDGRSEDAAVGDIDGGFVVIVMFVLLCILFLLGPGGRVFIDLLTDATKRVWQRFKGSYVPLDGDILPLSVRLHRSPPS